MDTIGKANVNRRVKLQYTGLERAITYKLTGWSLNTQTDTREQLRY